MLRRSTSTTSSVPWSSRAMRAGAISWAGIVRMVNTPSGHALMQPVGEGSGVGRADQRSTDSPSLDLPSREVCARGGGPIEVVGPIDIVGAVEVHDGMRG